MKAEHALSADDFVGSFDLAKRGDPRPPSYTDRILAHSLSDRAHRLELRSYRAREGGATGGGGGAGEHALGPVALDGSDHACVSAVALLSVDATVTPQQALAEVSLTPSSRGPPPSPGNPQAGFHTRVCICDASLGYT